MNGAYEKKISWLLLFLVALWACQKDELQPTPTWPALMEIPQGFPPIEFPTDNAFTQIRWDLGKQLFFDPILSVDSTVSCATCHLPELAFTDGLPVSVGVANRLGTRNAPSLGNIAYHPYFTREGGVPTLEMQILVPIQEHAEFDFNIVLLAERLRQDSQYLLLAQEAYGRTPDPFVITRAIACFERSLLTGHSPYDAYTYLGQTDALSPAQQRGRALFFSKQTNCFQCHGGFNFTNYAFENNGLYQDYPDPGRFRLTGLEEDRARFKVPSLRNVEWTAPYMHDGSLASLEAVVEHYQSGGTDHPHKSALIKPLGLSEREKQDLIEFLRSLSDETFLENPLFQ